HLLQPLRRAPAVVGTAAREQRLDMRPIGVESLALPVRRVRPALVRSLVPVQRQPMQHVVDLALAVLAEARAVGVLETQHELPALLPCKGKAEERDVRRTDVRITRRRRRDAKTNAHRATTGFVSVPRPSTDTDTDEPALSGP